MDALKLIRSTGTATILALSLQTAAAQDAGFGLDKAVEPDRRQPIAVVSDEAGSTSMRMMSELANLAKGNIRLVPVAGTGALQNLNDLFEMKGIDAAIVQSDVLDHALENKLFEDMARRLRLFARLGNREVHLIVRSDQVDLKSLNGKRVSIGPAGSGQAVTAANIFTSAGVQVEAVNMDYASALDALKTGQIDGLFYTGGKPVPFLHALDPADGLKLLPVPFTASLEHHYRPAQITPFDYRGLVQGDDPIETVSVGSAMMAYNWPKRSQGSDRLRILAKALFGSAGGLRSRPHHSKWRSINLAATLPGWEHHVTSREQLETAIPDSGESDKQVERLRATFKAVLNALPQADGTQ